MDVRAERSSALQWSGIFANVDYRLQEKLENEGIG
jgi:hypothetical protein